MLIVLYQLCMETAKSGQIAGISLANVGCTFNGINPLVAIKLWNRMALPKMLHGAELWTLNRMKLSKLEEVQNTFLRVFLGLLGGTSSSAARGLVGLWSTEGEIDKRKLLFFRRLIHASEQCIHHTVFYHTIDQMEVESKQDHEVYAGYCQNLEEVQFVGVFGQLFANWKFSQ